MRLLALDPGNRITGYAVFVDGALTDAGTIRIPHKKLAADRYLWALEALAGLSFVYGPFEEAVIEVPSWTGTYNRRRSPKSVAGLYTFIGATMLATRLLGARTSPIAARKVTKAHRAEIVRLWLVQDGFELPDSPDAIDAIYAGYDFLGRDGVRDVDGAGKVAVRRV